VGSYPAAGTTTTFWLANVGLYPFVCCPEPPPIMTGPSPVIDGLNCIFTTAGAGGQHNSYQVMNTNDANDGNDSFAAQSTVNYSFTIKEFPVNAASANGVNGPQAHFFIVNGRDTTNMTANPQIPGPFDQAADWNMQNCIFVSVQSLGAGNGGIMNFRHKINESGGNSQIFAGTDASLVDTNTATLDCTGTWQVTFSGSGTAITLTGPSGATATGTLSNEVAAAFAESNGPSAFLLGGQPNTTTDGGSSVVYSQFSRTGNHAFTDNFSTDPALNTNLWMNFSMDVNGLVLVPPSAAWWIDWTLPAAGYVPIVAPIGAANWSVVTPIAQITNNGEEWALIPASALPSATAGQFAAKRLTYSQLLVVLPGQNFTPGVSPGYSGTPTEVTNAVANGGAEENITVYAVDAGYNLVTSVNDVIEISSTDTAAILPGNETMANGILTFSASNSPFYFEDDGTWTITAQDVTVATPLITGTSAPVVVSN
jgi:hypothetical protein